MKLRLAFFLALVVTLPVACGGSKAETRPDPQPTAPPPPPPPPAAPAAAPAPAAPTVDMTQFRGTAKIAKKTTTKGADALKLSTVNAGSGWEKCGMKAGDLLVSVDGNPVDGSPKIEIVAKACFEGGHNIIIERSGKEMKL